MAVRSLAIALLVSSLAVTAHAEPDTYRIPSTLVSSLGDTSVSDEYHREMGVIRRALDVLARQGPADSRLVMTAGRVFELDRPPQAPDEKVCADDALSHCIFFSDTHHRRLWPRPVEIREAILARSGENLIVGAAPLLAPDAAILAHWRGAASRGGDLDCPTGIAAGCWQVFEVYQQADGEVPSSIPPAESYAADLSDSDPYNQEIDQLDPYADGDPDSSGASNEVEGRNPLRAAVPAYAINDRSFTVAELEQLSEFKRASRRDDSGGYDSVGGRILLAICRLDRIGDALGPPRDCFALAEEREGQTYVLSLFGMGESGAPPMYGAAYPDSPPLPPQPNDAILKVVLQQGDDAWLLAAVRSALAAPVWELDARITPTSVHAIAPFRTSRLTPGWKETLDLRVFAMKASLLISNNAPPKDRYLFLRGKVMRTNNNSDRDLREARPNEEARYWSAIATTLRQKLTRACGSGASSACAIP